MTQLTDFTDNRPLKELRDPIHFTAWYIWLYQLLILLVSLSGIKCDRCQVKTGQHWCHFKYLYTLHYKFLFNKIKQNWCFFVYRYFRIMLWVSFSTSSQDNGFPIDMQYKYAHTLKCAVFFVAPLRHLDLKSGEWSSLVSMLDNASKKGCMWGFVSRLLKPFVYNRLCLL